VSQDDLTPITGSYFVPGTRLSSNGLFHS